MLGGEELKLIKITNEDLLSFIGGAQVTMALVIADNRSLIYMPDMLFMEEEASYMLSSNGFLCSEKLTKEIADELYNKMKQISTENLNILTFQKQQTTDKEINEIVNNDNEVLENEEYHSTVAKENLTKLNFYRARYKLVKLFVMGIKIKNKKIGLRPFISMLSNQDERLIRSWSIFTEEDLRKLEDTKLFENELDKIIARYLLDAGRFGYILDIDNKGDFDREIKKLYEEFLDFFKGENRDNEYNRFYKLSKENKNVSIDTLESILNNSKEDLINYLLKISQNDENYMNEIFNRDRLLLLQCNEKNLSKEETSRKFINVYIENSLKFPTTQEIIDRIDIKVDYYDISEELISDNRDFKEVLERLYPNSIKQINLREYLRSY